jgi:hypothetical protein
MNTRRTAAALLVAVLSHAVALPAVAQPEDATTKAARARFQEGVDAYDKGQYENARAAFLQAYALRKHPAVLLNLAQSSLKAGHPLEASQYFRQYLREATTATPAQRKDAESGLAEARQKLGRIEIIAPAGTEVTLDDTEKLGTAPFAEPIDVESGAHTLRSPAETVRVVATTGQVVQAKFGESDAAAAAAVVPVGGDPGGSSGDTFGDGAGGAASDPPPGADTGTKRTNLLARPENMTPVYIGAAAFGVGLIGTIVFAAFRGDAQSKADSVASSIRAAAIARGLEPTGVCNNPTPTVQRDFANACATLRDNNSKVDTNATVANISAVVMVAGAATAVGWYLFSPKRDDPRSTSLGKTTLVPYGGAGNAGLSLSGSF